MKKEKEFLTPPDVARMLDVSPDKVISWCRTGELRAVNMAASLATRPRYRIKRADLEAFLERRTIGPPPPRARRRRKTEPAGEERY